MEPFLQLKHISKTFSLSGNKRITALQDVNLDIYKGETLGIVGESGCGKSTLAKVIMGVYPDAGGSLYLQGVPLNLIKRKNRLAYGKQVQMVFQDPYSSLNPRMRVEDIVGENLVIHGNMTLLERKKRVEELLEAVGLQKNHGQRFPEEFSGGQRQRIGIARALALDPQLLVWDEPISALDVSVQSQIMNLLKQLREERDLTYLFIAHDLPMVHYISHRIAVMYRGHVVELGEADGVYEAPIHPYTKALGAAVLKPDPKLRWEIEDEVEEEPPRLTLSYEGCPYADCCKEAEAVCRDKKPKLKEIENGRLAACHSIG